MDLAPLLRAHAFLSVERPPLLWEVTADDLALVRLLGEMIAAALVRGNALHEVVLNVANVTVEEDEDSTRAPAPGDYVALTVRGRGECGSPTRWSPQANELLVSEDLDRAARGAQVPFAYTQSRGGEGSLTVFFHRSR